MANNSLGTTSANNIQGWIHAGNEEYLVDEIIPVIYDKLKKMAHFQKFSFHASDTLNTTALVHEAYLKLANSSAKWQNELHFYALAGKAMRQILINYAKSKTTKKRGENPIHIDANFNSLDISESVCEHFLALNQALEILEQQHPREARIVEHRFFAGMTIEETAQILNLSPATVKRSWQVAKVWLLTEMSHD